MGFLGIPPSNIRDIRLCWIGLGSVWVIFWIGGGSRDGRARCSRRPRPFWCMRVIRSDRWIGLVWLIICPSPFRLKHNFSRCLLYRRRCTVWCSRCVGDPWCVGLSRSLKKQSKRNPRIGLWNVPRMWATLENVPMLPISVNVPMWPNVPR